MPRPLRHPGIRAALGRLTALALAAASPAAPPCLAQRVMVPHNRPHAQVALVNVRTGALVDGAWIDVQATADPTPGNSELSGVERVDDEIWVAATFWIYRYEARGTRRFLGSFPMDAPVRSIDPQSDARGGRVLISTTDFIGIFDRDGRERGRLPIEGAGDTLELESSMLVALQDDSRVDRYGFDGQWLGVFAGPSVPTSLGLLSEPRQLSRRSNGNVLIAGDVRIYEYTPTGEFLGEYDVGPFEGGVIESISGRLFVPLQEGVAVYDAHTGRATPVGGLYFGQGRRVGRYDEGTRLVLEPGDWASDVTCRGAVHSQGDRARIGLLGSPDLREESLSVFVDRMPPLAQALLLFSTAQEVSPAGSLGHLCLDRDQMWLVGSTELADQVGHAQFQVARGGKYQIALGAGSTWHAQSLYRDGTALRFSSALTFTLKP